MKRLYAVVPREVVEKPQEFRSVAPSALACFQALWRPELLRGADRLPEVRFLDDLPNDPDGLALSPGVVAARAEGVAERFGRLVSVPADATPESAAALLELPPLDPDLAADFHAFGFAYWLHGLLHRAFDSASALDAEALRAELLAAGENAERGEPDGAKHHLRMAWEALHTARQALFPAQVGLLDVAMSRPDAADGDWPADADGVPWNALVAGADLDRWAAAQPALLAKLKDAADRQLVDVLGGVQHDAAWGALPIESKLWQLDRAHRSARQHLDRDLHCFAARGMALDAHAPLLLHKHQFRYALHLGFAGGRWPRFRKSKIKWGRTDGSHVEALTGPAVDAGDPGGAFVAAAALGRALKEDTGPALLLVHWLGRGARWLADWRRGDQYAPAAGKFQTVGDYFLNSPYVADGTPTFPEDYASDVFAAPTDPVSRWAERHARRGRVDAAKALTALAHIATKGAAPADGLAALAEHLETDAWQPGDDAAVEAAAAAAARRLAEVVLKADAAGATPGYLVFNPTGATFRAGLRNLEVGANVPLGGAIRAVQPESAPGAGDGAAVLDLPAWGFTWLPAVGPADAPAREPPKPMAEGRRLRNDLIEAELDRRTGGLRGLWDVRTSFSRFGQQLAYSGGSQMLCSEIAIVANHAAFAELRSAGELRTPERASKKTLAEFTQTFRLWRRRAVLEIEIELRPKQAPKGDPATDYYGCRWAWADSKTLLSVSDGGPVAAHHGEAIDAPRLLEFRERQLRTLLLPRGLPRHLRVGPNYADTPLVVRGETARRFSFAVALDVPNPLAFAQADAQPPWAWRVPNGPPAFGPAGWFARLGDARAHGLELAARAAPEPCAFVRLLEIAGETGRVDWRTCQPAEWARLVNGLGELIFTLYPVGDAVPLDCAARELVVAEAGFAARRQESGPGQYGD